MTEKLPFHEICMNIAKMLTTRATCKSPNRQVGCVIVTAAYDSIVAWGYNGGAAKLPDTCESSDTASVPQVGNRCTCSHAEMNALVKMNPVDQREKIMFLTLSPCNICATLIINANAGGANIKTVVYLEEYRDSSPVFKLRSAGIGADQYDRYIRFKR